MNIGFDAKRAYHNNTGLGHYSRTLINLLLDYYPAHDYYLFNPKRSSRYKLDRPHLHEILPISLPDKLFTAAWRSSWVKKDLRKWKIDLYHGLSHEIPIGIRKTGVKSVVTIHDLIPEHFPGQYNPIDVRIYRKKFRYACEQSDRIIAISEQTKSDIVSFYQIDPAKIEVCLQSCSPLFAQRASASDKERVRAKYRLPARFFLSVGSIVERKNLLNVCKAFFLLRNEMDLPLVVVGNGGKYKQQVKDFILQHDLEKKIIFLSERPEAKTDPGYLSTPDLVVLYQLARAMIYPSFYEGFGAPVLEALWCRLPVITSNVSCLPEVAGPGSLCVDPTSAEAIADAIRRVNDDDKLVDEMIEAGLQHTTQFTPEKYAASVMGVYQTVMNLADGH